jgi:hypothetical protein
MLDLTFHLLLDLPSSFLSKVQDLFLACLQKYLMVLYGNKLGNAKCKRLTQSVSSYAPCPANPNVPHFII